MSDASAAGSPDVAFWPHTTRNTVASYRIRCAQLMPALATQGIRTRRFAEGRPAPDVLVLSKQTREPALDLALSLKARHGTRLVLDVCDNIFFRASGRAAGRTERLRERLNRLDAIVTPSAYLRDVIAAELRPDIRLEVIPDAVETEPAAGFTQRLREAPAFLRFARLRDELARSGVAAGRRLVWYGISGTRKARNGLYDVDAFAPLIEAHDARQPLSLTVITDNRGRYDELIAGKPFRSHFVRWNHWTFAACLRLHDIAVLPVQRNDYNWAKSANRLTTAIANGLAVCASAIPSYEPFQDAAVLDDWDEGLARLMVSGEERLARTAAGRAVVERDYTLQAVTRKWAELIAALVDRREGAAA